MSSIFITCVHLRSTSTSPNLDYLVHKMHNYITVYFGHGWPPNFGPTSVWSLLYTPKSLLFTPIYFLCLPPLVVSVCGHREHMRGARTTGRGGSRVWNIFSQMCARNYSVAQFIAPSQGLMLCPSPDPGPIGEWGGELWARLLIHFLKYFLYQLKNNRNYRNYVNW